jgi:hypothetical protein
MRKVVSAVKRTGADCGWFSEGTPGARVMVLSIIRLLDFEIGKRNDPWSVISEKALILP